MGEKMEESIWRGILVASSILEIWVQKTIWNIPDPFWGIKLHFLMVQTLLFIKRLYSTNQEILNGAIIASIRVCMWKLCLLQVDLSY